MAGCCDLSQREAIQLIIQDMLRQVQEIYAEIEAGKREASAYIMAIDKNNYLGKVLISLATAFEVELPAGTMV